MEPNKNKPSDSQASWPTREYFDSLVTKANTGDAAAIAALRTVLDEHPQIWQDVGDMGRHAESALIAVISKGDQLRKESLERFVIEQRQNLMGPTGSPLETLAVNRVVFAWLTLQHAESQHAKDPTSVTLIRCQEAVKAGAQRRLDAAIKTAMLVREKMPAIERAEMRPLRVMKTG